MENQPFGPKMLLGLSIRQATPFGRSFCALTGMSRSSVSCRHGSQYYKTCQPTSKKTRSPASKLRVAFPYNMFRPLVHLTTCIQHVNNLMRACVRFESAAWLRDQRRSVSGQCRTVVSVQVSDPGHEYTQCTSRTTMLIKYRYFGVIF